ncbi:MAG TPA: metallophosphoesterase family protein [Fimbriiglobus sp.]|nr:metallophosphoesterase family protein [Fimbriiglobus sp.]
MVATMRTLAIGDVHGASATLDALLAVVRPTPEDLLVFLGDYVDRGPDTRGVLDRLIALEGSHRCVFLRGNHELMMTRARHDRGELRMWQSVGGRQALASYGPAATLADVPAAHWDFLDDRLVDYHETGTHIFVHANLFPELSLDEQPEEMLFWEFLGRPVRHVSGKTVVCGHSSQKSGEVLDLGDTICIDTFAYGGGWLTCLDVGSLRYWQANLQGQTREGWLDPR